MIPTEPSFPRVHQSGLIPPGIYEAKFISRFLMSTLLIPQLKQSFLQESLTVMRLWSSSFHTIAGITIGGNNHRLFRNEPSTNGSSFIGF
jgi:hypothetical protein